MANAGEDDNSSQFFFTLGYRLDMKNKHTIFCRLTGETIYNMLELEEAFVDENGRSLYPPKMRKTEISNNPFSYIIPRIMVQKSEEVKDSSKTKTAAVKDFNLPSFGEEADEDEEESVILNKKFSGKGKSVHDHLIGPKLTSQPAVESLGLANKKRKEDHSSKWESDDDVKTEGIDYKERETVSLLAMKERIGNKLRDAKKQPKKIEICKMNDVEGDKDAKGNE
ncbi:Peptidyl-prolyl cis-trans isomerase CWC27 like protein [Eufriesea mexicana]|uniref:Peptidyl-prolyl cis-trans isomerase CWC27 like protein n=1 Tax=Eufriesea mexicana TaxID=516756 RepID=A0A310SJE5_9HYME|nr:Peptidyl-prolyl cis-trans isomerase CWC27 like protein [Eufriesea mexicana]